MTPAAAVLLAAQKVPDADQVSPGFTGFAVIFLLTVATILLIRSMTKQLRKVRYSPDPARPDAQQHEPGSGHPET